MSVYDPVFTPEDMSLFEELKIQLLAENKAGLSQYLEQHILIVILTERRILDNTSDDMFHATLRHRHVREPPASQLVKTKPF